MASKTRYFTTAEDGELKRRVKRVGRYVVVSTTNTKPTHRRIVTRHLPSGDINYTISR